MKSERIAVAECSTGDILADDVYSKSGVMLLTKGYIVNDFIKMKLKEFGIFNVAIYNSCAENSNSYTESLKNYKESIIQLKALLNEIASGKLYEHGRVSLLSEQIYKNISDNGHIIQCLQGIRSTDEYTYTHCLNTALYSMLIGKWLKLPENRIHEVIHAGLLHDIGKIKVPNKILNKNGKLSTREFEIIKKHPTLGFEMIKDISDLTENVKKAVLLHHERINGTGYPQGLVGDSIGLYAKIVAIADVFDAMTQNRVYKKKATPFEAFQMFLTVELSGFDITILNTFLKQLAPLYVGTKVLLNNGDMGEIVYVPPHDIINPILSVNSEYIDLGQNSRLKVVSIT